MLGGPTGIVKVVCIVLGSIFFDIGLELKAGFESAVLGSILYKLGPNCCHFVECAIGYPAFVLQAMILIACCVEQVISQRFKNSHHLK